MNKENEILSRKLEREREARQQAESLLEEKSLMLYESNKKLIRLNKLLENVIELRTKKLSEREHEYFAIVESIADIICKVNLQGEITFANQIASEIFKGKRMELLGRSIWDFVPKIYKQRAFLFFAKQFVHRNRNTYLEIPIIPFLGEELWVRVNIQFTEERCMGCELRSCFNLDHTNKKEALFTCDFKEIIIVAHDITDKKKAENEIEQNLKQQGFLSEILAKYNSLQIFDTINQEVIEMVGKYMDISRIYIYRNISDHYLDKIYEWKEDSIQAHANQIHYENVNTIKKIVDQNQVVIASEQSEYPMDLKDIVVTNQHQATILLPIQIWQGTKGIIGFDICNRKYEWTSGELKFLRSIVNIISTAFLRNETQINLKKAKRKAEEASKIKSDFLADISHEIRTSLNVVLGLSEWLNTNVSDKEHKNYLHTILTNGRTMLNQVNDILGLPKTESGNVEDAYEVMQVHQVLRQLEQKFHTRLHEKQIEFISQIHSSVPEYILMDEVCFYRMLFSLISNSINNIINGTIRLEVKALHTSDPMIVHLLLSYTDTRFIDSKMNQNSEDNLFGKSSEGMLPMLEELTQKLNGKLDVKVERENGIEISIKLCNVPIGNVIESEDKVSKEQDFILEPCKILIVDDFPFNIMVLKRIIDFDNVIFYEAESGQVALDLLAVEKPDLIFTDIRMPGMSGFEVVEKIREREELNNVPVVAFTASSLPEEIAQIKDNFDYYLHKPVSRKEVFYVLRKFLPVTLIS